MQVKVFGCKVNKYYSERWLAYFLNQKKDDENAVLIASCEVTDKAKKKRTKEVTDALLQQKNVYLTGCGAFTKGDVIAEEKFYTQHPVLKKWKNSITLLPEEPPQISPSSLQKTVSSLHVTTRKFIVVQQGCDSFCSFCLTIHKRGSHSSRPLEAIIEEIQAYEAQGGKEIILTGINVMARGAGSTRMPSESRFPFLLEQILKRTSIPRIRISSIGPEFVSDSFFAVCTDQRILPYFHISVQHIADPILQSMQRNYTGNHIKTIITTFRSLARPDVAAINIGADIISGFPGETDDQFTALCSFVEEYAITQLHAFPFSPHAIGETVPAGHFPQQISPVVKKERAKKLMLLGATIKSTFTKTLEGTSRHVLREQKKNSKRQGWTDNYISFSCAGDFQRNEITTVVFTRKNMIE